jgi:predicted RecB family nuclease
MVISSKLFEAYLACPTKCYFLYVGDIVTGSDFTNWDASRKESYRLNGFKKLMTDHPDKICVDSPEPRHWKHESWHFALNRIVQYENIEATFQAVQRISPERITKSTPFVPIRFVPENKLASSDKQMAAYEALVLSRALGTKIGNAVIIHGDKGSLFTVKASVLSRAVNKTISHISALISSTSPPDIIMNRHCPECGFQAHCRKIAVNKDDLSLLANLPVKERARLNGKGIFTVSQLSYTFRPRRRIKRLASKPEKHHHSLKALAIREKKIYVIGNPQLQIDGTPIFLDVEGLPDRDFYYLVGVRVENNQGILQQNYWADTTDDEKNIWRAFLDFLLSIDRPVLFHYGSFETTFLKKMCDRYGGPDEGSVAANAIASSVNVLSVVFAKIYFPTYSNGLKEIARFLGFEWTDPSSSGLQSIIWRDGWESTHAPALRDKLVTYNAEDCEALSLVTHTLVRLLIPEIDVNKANGLSSEIIYADLLSKSLNSKWQIFKSPIAELEHINEAAHWSYQHDRVFVRDGGHITKRRYSSRKSLVHNKPEKVVIVKAPIACPECGKKWRTKCRHISKTVHDLVFGKDSLKRRVVRYEFQSYRCRSCGHEYGLIEWYLRALKWGWNVVAYFVYNIISLRIPQRTMLNILNRIFGFGLSRATLNEFKIKTSNEYLITKRKILRRIVSGNLVHADETRANIKGHLAYVWVLTNLKEVVYILAESREGEFIKELLKGFKGVLVTDFYAAYEAIPCPQQKCLIHLMRDLNDEILNNPFDAEMKSIALKFSGLLKPIVETIDRFGLKKRSLRKHLVKVDQFYAFLHANDFKSDAASKCKQRFEKNRDTLFTFLRYDGVPWNNNNAEHAIKAFARLRDVVGGSSTKNGIDEYLTLLSIAETCEYQGLDFLDFLLSGVKDIELFARGRRKYTRRKKDEARPKQQSNESSSITNVTPERGKLVDQPSDA